MARMSASYDGNRIVQQAAATAAAIQNLGGISKLTGAEQDKANRVFQQAAEKLTALGRTEAAAMYAKLADETKRVVPPIVAASQATQSWAASLGGDFKAHFLGVVAGFVSAQAIIGAVTGAFHLAVGAVGAVKDAIVGAVTSTANLGDLLLTTSKKFDVSVERASAWRYVAQQAGTSLDGIMSNIGKFQTAIGQGGEKVEKSLAALGTSLAAVRAMRPDEAFEQILVKLRDVPRESDRAAIGVGLFGRGFREVAQLTREDIGGMMARFNELGGTVTTEMAVAGDAFKDAKSDWNLLVERITTSVGSAILPAATAFINLMVNAVQKTLSDSGVSAAQFQDAVAKSFAAIVDISAFVLQAIGFLIKGFAELFTGKWLQESTGLVTAIGLVGSQFTRLGEAFATFNGQTAIAGIFKSLTDGFTSAMKLSVNVAIAAQESERVLSDLGDRMGEVGESIRGKGAAALAEVKRQVTEAAAAMKQGQATIAGGERLLGDAVEDTTRKLGAHNAILSAVVIRLQAFTLPLARLREHGIETTGSLNGLNQTLGVDMDSAMRRATVASADATERMARFRAGLDQADEGAERTVTKLRAVADAFRNLAQNLGGSGGILAGGFADIASAWDDINDSMLSKTEKTTAKIVSSFAVAANVISQLFGGSTNKWAVALTQGSQMAAMGAQIGAAWGGVGAGVGAAIGAVVGAISGYIMATKKMKEANIAATEEIQRLHRELLNTYGSEGTLSVLGRVLGVEVPSHLERGQQGLKHYKELLEQFNARMGQLTGALDEYGLTWRDLGQEMRQINITDVGKKLAEDFGILTRAGGDPSVVVRSMKDQLNALIVEAVRTGSEIPAALQPVLQTLIEMHLLSDEAFQALTGGAQAALPSLEDVRAAAERYGLELDELGPKVRQLEINAQAKQMAEDWKVLSSVVDDTGVLFDAMGPKVQAMVDDALRYGLELPTSMRPMIEAMLQAGELVDLNGQKLTDLGQLNWAQDLTASVTMLVDKMNELIEAIKGGVMPTLDDLGRTGTGNIQAVGQAAGEAADQMKSRFADGFTEVQTRVDDLADSLRSLPDEEITIVTTGIEEATDQVEELARVIGEVPRRVNVEAEVKAAGYKTREELEAIAGAAGRVYAEMERSGRYTSAVLQQAFEAWQKALSNIDPEPLNRAAQAGYQTKAALEEAAKASGSLYAEMLASGLYTTDTLKRAWEQWQDDLAAAGMGGLSSALRSELEGLRKMVEEEANSPEYDELGNRIYGVIEQAGIDRIKQIEDEAARAQGAVAGTTNEASRSMQATISAATELTKTHTKGAITKLGDLGRDGAAAFEVVEGAAVEVRIKIDDIWTAADNVKTLLDEADFGDPFRRATRDIEALIGAISRIPGGPGAAYGGGSAGMAAFAASQAARSDTSVPASAYYGTPFSARSSYAMPMASRGGDSVVVNVNHPVVRDDRDITRLTDEIVRRIPREVRAWTR